MSPQLAVTDDGRRCSDIVRQAIADGHARRWVAIRLSDGGSDGRIYDRKSDAIRHQLHEQQCAYVQIPLDDMPPGEATRFLALHREMYDAGLRIIDPDEPDRAVIIPTRVEESDAMLRALMQRRRPGPTPRRGSRR